jgi:predicted RNase H-like nuclease (RuvC/YqgF family)
LKLLLFLAYFCALAALSLWLYFSYTNERTLSETVSSMKTRNSVLRAEAAELERKTDDARNRVENLLAEQKRLEGESEKLKLQARELEAKWDVAKRCKGDFEEMSGEIETLKQQLSRIKPGNR